MFFDFSNDVDTFSRFNIEDMDFESQNKKFAVDYMPTHGIIFNKLMKKLISDPEKQVFVEISLGPKMLI